LLVKFTDLLQRSLQSVIVLQTLLHMRGLCFAQADLAHVTARITDGENGNRMSAAVCTLFAAGTVTDVAFKQGAAEDPLCANMTETSCVNPISERGGKEKTQHDNGKWFCPAHDTGNRGVGFGIG
jgi:hypothetical protein